MALLILSGGLFFVGLPQHAKKQRNKGAADLCTGHGAGELEQVYFYRKY